jgi:SGNH hydrolase-like domain, acetyltransferase AlgX
MTPAKFRNWTIAILFLGMISLPLLNGQLHIWDDFASSENRQLAPMPKFDVNLLDPFPKQFTQYYDDHFPFRFRLVSLYTHFQLDLLGQSPIPDQAVIGKDGWYFMAGKEMDSYLGVNALTPLELDSIRLELAYRRDYLQQLGSAFYFMVIPAKNNVYIDKMPYWAHQSSQKSWGEKLNAYLQARTKLPVIDLYTPFKAMRDQYMLYYKLDHHWSEIGAFWAAKLALERMHQDLPSVVPSDLATYDITREVKHSGSITGMFGITGDFVDTSFGLQPHGGFQAHLAAEVGYPVVYGFPYPDEFEKVLETPDTTKPNMLLITDSQGFHVFPILAESFHHSTKIFDSWQYKLNENIAAQEKADVVLLAVSEVNLRELLRFSALKAAGWREN